MGTKSFPVIDLIATGSNIRRLRKERGYTVRDLQDYFGFNEPQAIYKWQRGESLPSVDNLYALGSFFDVPIEQILIPQRKILHIYDEQQAETCCSNYMQKTSRSQGLFYSRLFRVRQCSDRARTIFHRTTFIQQHAASFMRPVISVSAGQ